MATQNLVDGINAQPQIEEPMELIAQAFDPKIALALQRSDALLMGLSDDLCVRRFASLSDEAFAEGDGELCFRLEPFTRWPFPFLGGMVQDEI